MAQKDLETKIIKVLEESNFQSTKKYKLIALLGMLGGFDSFEYAINLSKFIKSKKHKNIDIFSIAIGSLDGKKKFCKYTGFPEKSLYVVKNNNIHKTLGAYKGLNIGLGGWINMLLMLSGITSLKTIREVMRGYTGDSDSVQIYNDNDEIELFKTLHFSGNLFEKKFGSGYLRPFELATFRLSNMVEILSNWNDYILDTNYLPQRGGSFILNTENQIIYKYFSTDILSYSNKMSSPLDFISEITI